MHGEPLRRNGLTHGVPLTLHFAPAEFARGLVEERRVVGGVNAVAAEAHPAPLKVI